jgi:hypothetical protein
VHDALVDPFDHRGERRAGDNGLRQAYLENDEKRRQEKQQQPGERNEQYQRAPAILRQAHEPM